MKFFLKAFQLKRFNELCKTYNLSKKKINELTFPDSLVLEKLLEIAKMC